MPVVTLIAFALALFAGVAALALHLHAREEATGRAYRSASDARRRRNAAFILALCFLVVALIAWLVTL